MPELFRRPERFFSRTVQNAFLVGSETVSRKQRIVRYDIRKFLKRAGRDRFLRRPRLLIVTVGTDIKFIALCIQTYMEFPLFASREAARDEVRRERAVTGAFADREKAHQGGETDAEARKRTWSPSDQKGIDVPDRKFIPSEKFVDQRKKVFRMTEVAPKNGLPRRTLSSFDRDAQDRTGSFDG